MCNGPAREGKINSQLVESGQKIGDPFESSTLQREDFSSHKGTNGASNAACFYVLFYYECHK